MVKVKEIVNRFYRFAPRFIAEPNDPVGLQLGDMEHEVKKMMLTLDVRPDVVKEAIEMTSTSFLHTIRQCLCPFIKST